MRNHEERAPDDALRNHPLRDTQEFESDIRAREVPAGLGTVVGGPIGAIIGAIAGAVGGWWVGQAAVDPATTITPKDDARYRALYEDSPNRLADRSYEDIRAFYYLGHLASSNPDYHARHFEDIEPELQKAWTADLRAQYGDWVYVRQFAKEGFSGSRRTDEE